MNVVITKKQLEAIAIATIKASKLEQRAIRKAEAYIKEDHSETKAQKRESITDAVDEISNGVYTDRLADNLSQLIYRMLGDHVKRIHKL